MGAILGPLNTPVPCRVQNGPFWTPNLGQSCIYHGYTGYGPLIIPVDDITPKYTPNWVHFGVISGCIICRGPKSGPIWGPKPPEIGPTPDPGSGSGVQLSYPQNGPHFGGIILTHILTFPECKDILIQSVHVQIGAIFKDPKWGQNDPILGVPLERVLMPFLIKRHL